MTGPIQDKPRCIVLPLQDQDSAGIGLALHFLLGNVIAAHTAFKECWFGWRAAKIFPQPEALKRYCHGLTRELDLLPISREQDVRCWVMGWMDADGARLRLVDARVNMSQRSEACSFSFQDHLVGFRQCFLNLLDSCGFPLSPQRWPMALWPEYIGRQGLRLVGRALEAFYLHSAYAAQAPFDLSPFQAALKSSPESFMAHNLLGWALYRRQDTAQAKASFSKALALNPAAIGPMAGLIRCAVLEKDLESTLHWTARKAQVREHDVSAAMEKARGKVLSARKP